MGREKGCPPFVSPALIPAAKALLKETPGCTYHFLMSDFFATIFLAFLSFFAMVFSPSINNGAP
jgi:hypothetical protein